MHWYRARPYFADRRDAGRQLARRLAPDYADRTDVVVLALPRGGVPVAYEVARSIGAPLDVLVVRKLGVPFQPELAFGAVGGDVVVLIPEVIRQTGLTDEEIEECLARERREMERRERAFRLGRPAVEVEGKTAIVVDDGIATGATVRAAVRVLRRQRAARVIVAIPFAPPSSLAELRQEADTVVCLHAPSDFYAVGQGYRSFPQLSDEEVRQLLRSAAPPAAEGRVPH